MLGDFQNVGVKVAEGGREEDFRPIQFDHIAHRLLHRDRLRDLCFLDGLDPLQFGYPFLAGGVGLIIAIVVFRPDINEAHDDLLLSPGGDSERYANCDSSESDGDSVHGIDGGWCGAA